MMMGMPHRRHVCIYYCGGQPLPVMQRRAFSAHDEQPTMDDGDAPPEMFFVRNMYARKMSFGQYAVPSMPSLLPGGEGDGILEAGED